MAQGDYVSVPEKIITDIAALKQSQSDLRRQVDEGNRNTQQAIAAMSGRLEGVTQLLQQVARIAERQDAHGSGLERAFSSIKQVDERVNDVVENAAKVEKRLSLWHGVALGLSLAASVVVGILAWAGNSVILDMRGDIAQERDSNKSDDRRLDRLERNEAIYHGDTTP